jgi:hypothetical protein
LNFSRMGIISARALSWKWPGVLLMSLVVSLGMSPAEAAYRVTDLSFRTSPGEIRMTIQTDGAVQYGFFTMDESQPRLVIDLANAVHALERHRHQPPVEGALMRVRTSQYRPYPDPVVRVVLDFRRLMPFEMEATDEGLAVVLQEPPRTAALGEEPGRSDGHLPDAEQRDVVLTAAAPETAGASPPNEPGEVVPRLAPSAESEASEEAVTANAPPVPEDRPISEPSPKKVTETAQETSLEMTLEASLETSSPDSAGASEEQGTLMSRLLALGIREPVSYHSGGRRDPFVPLPAKQEVEFGQAPLPDVEKLSIVGILQGIGGYRALVQDDADNGYVLRKGDRVLYGYVARIEAERVVFYLNRRGLDRTVILKIPQ